MRHSIWPETSGNGRLTGLMQTTIETALLVIHRGRRPEIRPSCAAAGGAISRSTCARRTATGTRPRFGTATSGFGARRLCNPFPLVLWLLCGCDRVEAIGKLESDMRKGFKIFEKLSGLH